jgi:hypothetical protein
VELISPPINTIANGAMSGLGFNAIGSSPQIAVMEVSTTGRKRVSPAILMASSMLWPSARNWLVTTGITKLQQTKINTLFNNDDF